jgi:hypothetical membrane protein
LERGNLRLAGSLFFVGAAQFLFMMTVAEAFYPGYDISTNRISDLGATCSNGVCVIQQPTSIIFNSSVTLLGLLGLVGLYFFYRGTKGKLATILLLLTSIGATGVGLFPETTGVVHFIVSSIAFIFAGLAAIATYKFQRAPMSYFSVILGVFILATSILYSQDVYLGLGAGGMERMIVYPAMVWLIGLGSQLVARGESPRY